MSQPIKHFLWDSNVFLAYLNNETEAYNVASIGQFLEEAKNGLAQIYMSTISYAEIYPSRLKEGAPSTFEEFVADLEGVVIPVSADPDIMTIAGRLRDAEYSKSSGKRTLSTPDAIILSTALRLNDAYGVEIDALHTFDKGRRTGPEGKHVPLIGYVDWCEGLTENQHVQRACSLTIEPPIHPEPKLT